jgi:hypothetical protein
LACDIDQKEGGFNAIALCEFLIRTGHSRDKFAPFTKHLERAVLCFASDKINGSVRVPNFLKALRPVVNHRLCAEVARGGNIVRAYGRDYLQTRMAGQSDRLGPDVAHRTVNHHRLTRLELSVVKQGLPGCNGNDRNGGSFNVS